MLLGLWLITFSFGLPKKVNRTLTYAAVQKAVPIIAIEPIIGLKSAELSYISHLLANPFKGGIPTIAAAPIKKAKVVLGMVFASPLSSFKFLVPSSCNTAPPLGREGLHHGMVNYVIYCTC